MLYVIRHAKAGNREKWVDDQHLRPLTKAGWRQATALVDPLSTVGITRLVSSPSIRCRQTIEPLARALQLSIDRADAIDEGAPLDETLALVDKVADENAVICTHGDVVGNLLVHAERHGVRVGEPRMEKAGTWAFDLEAGAIVSARYTPPPTA